jgi:signal transduction histidine kinase
LDGQIMTSRLSRRQILLFLVAIVLPCSVLVALSLVMMSQQRELAEKRSGEEHRRVLKEASRDLAARLEKLKLQQVTTLAAQESKVPPSKFVDPSIVLVGWVEGNRMLLPWDVSPVAERSRRLLRDPTLTERIQQGEREEFAANQAGKAAVLYRNAMNVARDPVQAAYAKLLLARALAKSGQPDEAVAHLRGILTSSANVTDEQGIPFCLYAAQRLLQAGLGYQAILERLDGEIDGLDEAAPPEVYMMRDLANTLAQSAGQPSVRAAANDLERRMLARVRFLEEALALQNDFSKLGLNQTLPGRSQSNEPLWVPYGKEYWLVSVAPPLGGLPAVAIAVRANDAFASLNQANAGLTGPAPHVQWSAGRDPQGELLGENFPGLRVRILAAEASPLAQNWDLQRSFYLFTLLLVLSATLFGAYLLWRDVQRELRLAEMRSQFVASVSHELKTPLTAIRMFAETLRMGRATETAMQSEYLDTIINESERLTRLLNNVLDFSKIEQGRKAYRPEPTPLSEVVEAAARTMHYPLAQQGLQLHVEIANDLPAARVDPDAIEQAILNLLANAMKYSGPGTEIDLRLCRQNGDAVIQVADRGIGIPAQEQSRIFEKFYRVPTPENQRLPGTGLGLTLVEHIAKAHGGRVEVQSAPGKGSTFSIYLPLEGKA